MNKQPDDTNSAPKAIPLGYWPAINAYYHRCFSQSSLLIQIFSGEGAIDAAALDESLRATSRRHPLLNCRLVEGDSGFTLHPLTDDSRRLETLSVGQLDSFAIAGQLLSEGIGDEMWRVVLARSDDKPAGWALVMVCHHAIGDAISMLGFFDQLLTHYSQHTPQNSAAFELPKLPEKLGGVEIAAANVETAVAEWQIDRFEALEDRHVGLLEVPLPEEAGIKLLEASEQERVSLTNLITVALLRARGLTDRARVATAVDIRRRVKPAIDARQFGCYAGVIESTVPWASDIWEHARLSAVYQFRGKNRLLMPVPHGSILKQMMRSRINRALGSGFCAGGCAVSDVGEVAVQQRYGPLSVDAIHLANRQLAGLYGVFLTASRFNSRLTMNLSYANPLLSVEHAEMLAQGLAAQLEGCIA